MTCCNFQRAGLDVVPIDDIESSAASHQGSIGTPSSSRAVVIVEHSDVSQNTVKLVEHSTACSDSNSDQHSHRRSNSDIQFKEETADEDLEKILDLPD